jgi:hypothetical protein
VSSQHVHGQVCSQGVDELVGQEVQIDKELQVSLAREMLATTTMIALVGLGYPAAAVVTVIAAAAVTAATVAITLVHFREGCFACHERVLYRRHVVARTRNLKAYTTPAERATVAKLYDSCGVMGSVEYHVIPAFAASIGICGEGHRVIIVPTEQVHELWPSHVVAEISDQDNSLCLLVFLEETFPTSSSLLSLSLPFSFWSKELRLSLIASVPR